MAVSTHSRQVRYPGNDAAVSFPFRFKIFTPEELWVTQSTATGSERPLSLGVDYQVQLASETSGVTGGSVILRVPLPAGDSITLQSRVPLDQPLVFTAQSVLKPPLVERAFDRVTIQLQQLYEALKGKGSIVSNEWEATLTERLSALKAELTQQLPSVPAVPFDPFRDALEKAVLQLLDQIQAEIDQGKTKLTTQQSESLQALQTREAQLQSALTDSKDAHKAQLKEAVQTLKEEAMQALKDVTEAQTEKIQEALDKKQTEHLASLTQKATEIETSLDQSFAQSIQEFATALTTTQGESL